jgi:hypothetical protein
MKETRKVWESLPVRWKRRSKKIKNKNKVREKKLKTAAGSNSKQRQQTTAADNGSRQGSIQQVFRFGSSGVGFLCLQQQQRQRTTAADRGSTQRVFSCLCLYVFSSSSSSGQQQQTAAAHSKEVHSGFSVLEDTNRSRSEDFIHRIQAEAKGTHEDREERVQREQVVGGEDRIGGMMPRVRQRAVREAQSGNGMSWRKEDVRPGGLHW